MCAYMLEKLRLRYGFNKNSPSTLIRMCKEEICLYHNLPKTCVGSNSVS